MRFLKRIGPAVLGAVVALSVNLVLGTGFSWLAREEISPISGTYWTYSSDPVRVLLLTSLPLFAHAVGGFVSGRFATSAPGISGAFSAVFAALAAVGRMLVGTLSIVLPPDPDAVPLSEEAGFLFALAGLFAVYFPFTVLAGYAGGGLGGLGVTTRS